jgi:hypothetical protein
MNSFAYTYRRVGPVRERKLDTYAWGEENNKNNKYEESKQAQAHNKVYPTARLSVSDLKKKKLEENHLCA